MGRSLSCSPPYSPVGSAHSCSAPGFYTLLRPSHTFLSSYAGTDSFLAFWQRCKSICCSRSICLLLTANLDPTHTRKDKLEQVLQREARDTSVSNAKRAPSLPPHTDFPPVYTIPQATPNQKLLKWYLIGGISGGGFLIFIIALITCCCICALHKREKASKEIEDTISGKKLANKKKKEADAPAGPVSPSVAAAYAAAAQEKQNSPKAPATPSAANEPIVVNMPRPVTPPAAAEAKPTAEPAAPSSPAASPRSGASVALEALKTPPRKTRKSYRQSVVPDAIKLEESDETSSDKSLLSSSSSSSEAEEEESEEEEVEPVQQHNFDIAHVDDEGFDDW